MVLRHVLAGLCEMLSVTPIITDRYIEEDPLHRPHTGQIWILCNLTPRDTCKPLYTQLLLDNEEALHRAVDACQTIRDCPGMSEHVAPCTESHGGYYKYSIWSESASEIYRPSDRRLSAKWLSTFADRGCHVVSVTDPYGRILVF
jgi:hypothetical protein